MSDDMTFSRRQLVGAGLALAAAWRPAFSRAAASQTKPGRVELYARARGGAGDEPGLWWYTGSLWGQPVNQHATRLFAVEGFSFNRMQRLAGGGLRQVMEECGFWLDPDTGEVVDDWINPMNGLDCTAGHYRARQELVFDVDGDVRDSDLFQGYITDATVSGPTLWISESLFLNLPSERRPAQDPLTWNGPVRTATSLVTYTLDAQAALAASPGLVPCTMHFQSMSSWYPWMRMGQAPGHQMFELFGRKLAHIDEIPARLRAILEERRAGFLDSPNL